MDETPDPTAVSEQVFDIVALTAALALMLDGLRVVAETGGGYRKLLLDQGFAPPVADAVAGDWVRTVQQKFFGGTG